MNAPLTLIQEIDSTIAHSSGARRAEMVRHLTDLYVVNADQYSGEEIELIDDVFMRLVVTIEESARALLALRLATIAKPPPKIICALARDDAIDVASPVLMFSEQIDESVLIDCAKTKSQEHLLAISRRKKLTEGVTDILVERGDEQVVLSTVKNSRASFSAHGFDALVRRAEGNELLTRCVGSRVDLPHPLLERLLEKASDTVRAKLERESPHAVQAVGDAVDEVTDRIWSRTFTQTADEASAEMLAEALRRGGQLDAARLEALAKAGRFADTVFALATMTDLPANFVELKLNDDHPEFLLVMAKAIGLPWSTTSAILTLRAGKNGRSASDVEQCQRAFNRLSGSTAQQILGFHRNRVRPGPKRQM